MRETIPLKVSLMVTLSAPVKPGALTRLVPGFEFEKRLVEAVIILNYIDDSYERGRLLADGELTIQKIGLGELVLEALREAYRSSGLKPLSGLVAAALTLSTLKGFADRQGRGLRGALRSSTTLILYRSSLEDSLKLLEGLEAVSSTEHLSLLDKRGVTRTKIRLEALTLGDLYEILGEADSGFWLNSRKLDKLLEYSKIAASEKSMTLAAIKSYTAIAIEKGLRELEKLDITNIVEALKLDRSLRSKGYNLNHLLGGTFIAIALAASEKWPWEV
ncbi:MAG: hypothetical protein P3X22_003950 [Thermoprotei archaeon]|nr:hypothetical protein [Thermoprotei archaeon]